MKKRILTLMGLALVLALCLLAGCTGNGQTETDTDTATESGDADAESGGQAGVTQGSGIKLVGGESHGSHTQQGHGVQGDHQKFAHVTLLQQFV